MRGSKLCRGGCDSVEWGEIVRPSHSWIGTLLRLYFGFLTPEGIVKKLFYILMISLTLFPKQSQAGQLV